MSKKKSSPKKLAHEFNEALKLYLTATGQKLVPASAEIAEKDPIRDSYAYGI